MRLTRIEWEVPDYRYTAEVVGSAACCPALRIRADTPDWSHTAEVAAAHVLELCEGAEGDMVALYVHAETVTHLCDGPKALLQQLAESALRGPERW